MTKRSQFFKQNKGFTLIELLVVISIIGLLSSVILAALNTARGNARNALRITQIKALQTALEEYYNDNGYYPHDATTVNYVGPCWTAGGSAVNYIPGLVPKYIASTPVEPTAANSAPGCGTTGGNAGYIYASNGTDYEFLEYGVVENGVPIPAVFQRPRVAQTGTNAKTYAIYTPNSTW